MLNKLQLESTRRDVTSYGVALAHIGLNEKEEAFVWLEKEVAERGYWAGVYAVAPELDDLRNQGSSCNAGNERDATFVEPAIG